MTATREFAELGQPTLAKHAYQIGAVEAESRALFRASLDLHGVAGADPPGNKAFETDLLLYVRDALSVVTALGLIGGPFPPVPYPGRDAALAAAGPEADRVVQITPNNASSSFVFSGPASLTAERP